MSSNIDELKAAHEHLGHALDHIAAGRNEGARQRIGLARACVERALDGAQDAIANPTGAMGAQTSNGQEPRDYSPEAIRQRDQRRGVEFCYNARLAQMGIKR